MKELASILSLKQPEELIDQLAETGYSFAVWRMPNSTESKFIISLTEPTQIPDFQIANTSPGFLINAFGDNHPIKPYFISADIIITNQNVEFSPNISDVQIDAFKEQINTSSKTKNPSNKVSQPTSNAFEALVEKAVAEIQKGTFEKVVLSRFKDEEIPSGFSPWQFFETISAQYANAFCSLSFIPGKGMWIGASPELLISDDRSRYS